MSETQQRHPLYTQGQRRIENADVAFPDSTLEASNRRLMSLDGARLVPSVEVINANNNNLDNFFGLITLPRLRCLFLENNNITSFAGMAFQPSMEILSMEGNPLCLHPMFRIMALLCIGESLRVINHRAVNEAERSLCQTLGGPSSQVAKLISLGWVDLSKNTDITTLPMADLLSSQQREFNVKVRDVYSAVSSGSAFNNSLQTLVEQMRVEEGIAGFTAGISGARTAQQERSQHGGYGMVTGKGGVSFVSPDQLPAADSVLGLRDHLYSDDRYAEAAGVRTENRRGKKPSPTKRPPWDYSPAPPQAASRPAHETLAMDTYSYNANSYQNGSRSPMADRGGPARAVPQSRDIYTGAESQPHPPPRGLKGLSSSAAQYQEEIDRVVAIDTARTFLNRVKHGDSTATLSVPVDPKNLSAAEKEAIEAAKYAQQVEQEDADIMKQWMEFQDSKVRARHSSPIQKQPTTEGETPYGYGNFTTNATTQRWAQDSERQVRFDDIPAEASLRTPAAGGNRTHSTVNDTAGVDEQAAAEAEAAAKVSAISSRLFNGTVLSPYKAIAREQEERSTAKAARASTHLVDSRIVAFRKERASIISPQVVTSDFKLRSPALLLNSKESQCISSLTLGPVNIYTSIPSKSSPVESLRNAMIAANVTRRSISIAVANASASTSTPPASIVAEIQLGEVADIELDTASGGTLKSSLADPHSLSLPVGGLKSAVVRISLENGVCMDIIPCNAADGMATARGIFKVLMLAKCNSDELQNFYDQN